MNNIKKYIKNIWAIMPMHTKKEKFYLNELIKRMKLKSIIQKFLIFFSVICTILAIWFGILWYSYIQDAKNSIIYDIETTITEN